MSYCSGRKSSEILKDPLKKNPARCPVFVVSVSIAGSSQELFPTALEGAAGRPGEMELAFFWGHLTSQTAEELQNSSVCSLPAA